MQLQTSSSARPSIEPYTHLVDTASIRKSDSRWNEAKLRLDELIYRGKRGSNIAQLYNVLQERNSPKSRARLSCAFLTTFRPDDKRRRQELENQFLSHRYSHQRGHPRRPAAGCFSAVLIECTEPQGNEQESYGYFISLIALLSIRLAIVDAVRT